MQVYVCFQKSEKCYCRPQIVRQRSACMEQNLWGFFFSELQMSLIWWPSMAIWIHVLIMDWCLLFGILETFFEEVCFSKHNYWKAKKYYLQKLLAFRKERNINQSKWYCFKAQYTYFWFMLFVWLKNPLIFISIKTEESSLSVVFSFPIILT